MRTTFGAEVGRLFLLWLGRFEHERCVGRLSTAEPGTAFERDCQRFLSQSLPEFHEDDIKSSLQQFFKANRHLAAWHQALLDERGIVIDFFDATDLQQTTPGSASHGAECRAPTVMERPADDDHTHFAAFDHSWQRLECSSGFLREDQIAER